MTAHPQKPAEHGPVTPPGKALPEASQPGPPPADYLPPEFVVEIWTSPQIRARHPDWPLSLHEAVIVSHRQNPEYDPEPEAEP